MHDVRLGVCSGVHSFGSDSSRRSSTEEQPEGVASFSRISNTASGILSAVDWPSHFCPAGSGP